ncbi:hypothetical protein [Kineococcus sp. SYSU DK005]|uniref:hypothetical protein n=1 Tax=Kineococcus sp. SYSU DK005 TaxID=3383126 RepID=UPI003D7D4BE0
MSSHLLCAEHLRADVRVPATVLLGGTSLCCACCRALQTATPAAPAAPPLGG